ncbi:MAG: type IX secretion system membrane protein PorP/SprF [Flavobacteriales bacterium]|nr:type IX secretion system membrane protein PorP/SprF [Flavobacteriales bacterium]
MKRLLTLAFLGALYSASAQQVPQFSQYLRNQYLVNPAAAGVYDFVDVTVGGRLQWLGFDDAPKTSYLYVSSPLKKQTRASYNPGIRISSGPVRNPEIKTGSFKHALGGQLIADQYGAFRQLRAAVTYALHMPISRDYNLSFGTNVGISNRSFLADRAQTLNMMTGAAYTDNTYDNFVANSGSQNTLDIGAGLYFYSKNMFVGVSADQLTKDFVKFGNVETTFDPNMHFQGTAGVKFPISKNLTLMPAILAKYTQFAPLSIEGSLQFEYKEWLWMGASFRNEDAIVAMAGLNISERFKFGYSYDFNISRMQSYSAGGHELVLGLMLGR